MQMLEYEVSHLVDKSATQCARVRNKSIYLWRRSLTLVVGTVSFMLMDGAKQVGLVVVIGQSHIQQPYFSKQRFQVTIYTFMQSFGDILSYCSDVVCYYTCRQQAASVLWIRPDQVYFWLKIIEFILLLSFIYSLDSGVSCCKFWHLDYARWDMLQVCWERDKVACLN